MEILEFDENDVVVIEEDTEVHAVCPCRILRSNAEIILRGKPGTFLELYADDDMQPCIGAQTNTHLSYGRFQLSSHTVGTVIIDGLTVVCYPNDKNPDFAIGTYGRKDAPNIECINGGTITCPEMTGTRIMTDNIVRYSGSTKCTGSAIYNVLKQGQTKFDIMSEEQKKLVDEIASYKPEFKGIIDCEYPVINLMKLLNVLKIAADRVDSLAPWKVSGNSTYFMTLRTCVILGMPVFYASHAEFRFELGKAEYILGKYFAAEGLASESFDTQLAFAMIMFAKLYSNRKVLSPILWEEAYEMIPSYYFDFKHDKSHAYNAALYLEQSLTKDFKSSYTMFVLTDEEVKRTLTEYVNSCPNGIDMFDFFQIAR